MLLMDFTGVTFGTSDGTFPVVAIATAADGHSSDGPVARVAIVTIAVFGSSVSPVPLVSTAASAHSQISDMQITLSQKVSGLLGNL